MQSKLSPIFAGLLILLNVANLLAESPSKVDVLLENGTIIDGSGGEPYEGSVSIADGRIVGVG